MPPNPNSEDATGDVICIADQFHFSSFYSSTNLAGLEDDDSVSTPTSTTPHRPSRSDSMSIIGPEEQVNGDARLKPHTIANPDRVKLKFYSNVLGDNSTFIHYVSLVFIGEFNVVIYSIMHLGHTFAPQGIRMVPLQACRSLSCCVQLLCAHDAFVCNII